MTLTPTSAAGGGTSGGIHSFPAAISECNFYLLKEIVLGNAQAQKRKSQDRVTVDGDVVLPQRILDDIPGMKMMDPVYLEDKSEILPVDVEEIASSSSLTNCLAIGFRQTSAPTLTRDINFAQGLRASQKVKQHALHEASSTVTTNVEKGTGNALCRRQPLLDDHREDQRRLTVGARPQCGMHRGDFRTNSWHSLRLDVFAVPSPGLANVDLGGPIHLGAARNRHTLSTLDETGQTSSDKTRDSVECTARTCFEHR